MQNVVPAVIAHVSVWLERVCLAESQNQLCLHIRVRANQGITASRDTPGLYRPHHNHTLCHAHPSHGLLHVYPIFVSRHRPSLNASGTYVVLVALYLYINYLHLKPNSEFGYVSRTVDFECGCMVERARPPA